MDGEQRNKVIPGCRRGCGCSFPHCPNRRRSLEEDASNNQRTFIDFLCETVSVIAFVIFGSIVFWLAVGGIILDFIKRIYYSDRYVRIFMGILFSALLLTMSFHYCLVNRRNHRKHLDSFKQNSPPKYMSQDTKTETKGSINDTEKKNSSGTPPPVVVAPQPPPPPPPPPPPEYMKISLKEKHLENINGEIPVENINKKIFTLLITDEKKKEVFKTSKSVFIPELAMEENRPILIVMLKDIVLEDY